MSQTQKRLTANVSPMFPRNGPNSATCSQQRTTSALSSSQCYRFVHNKVLHVVNIVSTLLHIRHHIILFSLTNVLSVSYIGVRFCLSIHDPRRVMTWSIALLFSPSRRRPDSSTIKVLSCYDTISLHSLCILSPTITFFLVHLYHSTYRPNALHADDCSSRAYVISQATASCYRCRSRNSSPRSVRK